MKDKEYVNICATAASVRMNAYICEKERERISYACSVNSEQQLPSAAENSRTAFASAAPARVVEVNQMFSSL